MPTISFEGDTHDEIVAQVKTWLASAEAQATPTPEHLVNQTASLTKDALRVVAEAAPAGIGDSDLVKALTEMGYKATDATREAALGGLATVESVSGGAIVKNVASKGTQALFEMNAQVAKQLLKSWSK